MVVVQELDFAPRRLGPVADALLMAAFAAGMVLVIRPGPLAAVTCGALLLAAFLLRRAGQRPTRSRSIPLRAALQSRRSPVLEVNGTSVVLLQHPNGRLVLATTHVELVAGSSRAWELRAGFRDTAFSFSRLALLVPIALLGMLVFAVFGPMFAVFLIPVAVALVIVALVAGLLEPPTAARIMIDGMGIGWHHRGKEEATDWAEIAGVTRGSNNEILIQTNERALSLEGLHRAAELAALLDAFRRSSTEVHEARPILDSPGARVAVWGSDSRGADDFDDDDEGANERAAITRDGD